jgi:hypothetical protein
MVKLDEQVAKVNRSLPELEATWQRQQQQQQQQQNISGPMNRARKNQD